MIYSQAMKYFLLMLIAGYAIVLGAGYYSIFTITIFFCLIVLSFILYPGTIKIKRDVLIYLAFAVYAVLSICYANYKWGALLFSSSILCGALYYLLLRNSEGWEEKLLYTLVICGVINGIFGIYQAIGQAKISALFYDKNAYSGFLTPLIPVSIYLQLRFKKRYLTCTTSFLIFSNLLSHSRAGICTTILALFVIVLYLWKNKEKEQIKHLTLAVLFGIISYFVFSYTVDLLLKPMPGLTEGAVDTSIGRFYIHYTALRAFLDAPIFGHGIYSFQGVSSTFINTFTIDPFIYSHAHNIFLNILVELGIVGLLIFLAFLFIVMKGPFYSKGFYFKIALLSFFLHNMYEYNYTAPPFQVILAVLCALIMEEKKVESDMVKPKRLIKQVLVYLLLCFFIFVYIPNVIGYLYSEKARKVDKNYKYLAYSAYFGYFISVTQENLASHFERVYFYPSKDDRNRQFFDIAEKYYLRALALDRTKGDLYIKIAKFYYRAGKQKIAEQYMLKVIQLFPYQPVYKYEYAKYYKSLGRYDEALKILLEVNEFFKKYKALSPFRIKVFNELAEDYKAIGDMKSYKEYNGKAYRLKNYLEMQP